MARARGGRAGRWRGLAALDLAHQGFPGTGRVGAGRSLSGAGPSAAPPQPHPHTLGRALVRMAESTLYWTGQALEK